MSYTGSKAFAGQGTQLQMGDGATPTESFATIAEIKNIQRTGSKADSVDTTNMDSVGAYREKLVTLLDAGEVSFTGNYVPSDTTQQALQTAFDGRVLHNWKITLPDSSIVTPTNTKPGYWSFKAYVTGVDFDLSFDKEATISGKLMITGKPTFTPEAE